MWKLFRKRKHQGGHVGETRVASGNGSERGGSIPLFPIQAGLLPTTSFFSLAIHMAISWVIMGLFFFTWLCNNIIFLRISGGQGEGERMRDKQKDAGHAGQVRRLACLR